MTPLRQARRALALLDARAVTRLELEVRPAR